MHDVKLCPKCTGDTRVFNSRVKKDGLCRQRICGECGYIFNTLEVSEKELKELQVLYDPEEIKMYNAFKQLFTQFHVNKN